MSDSKLADRRAKDWFIIALWALAAGVGILDLVYVLDTWWMGSDFQYIVLSVTALVHHRPVSKAFVYPPGMLILASPVILVNMAAAEDLLLVFELPGLAYTFRTMWRLIDKSLFSASAAGLAVALAVSVPYHVFQLENLTLILLPFVAGFYSLLVSRHWLGAGLVLGVSLTIKPMLAPLLLLLLLEKQWKAIAVGIGLPAVTSAIVLAVSSQPGRFVNQARNIVSGNDHGGGINVSGIGALWNVNGSVIVVVRVLLASATVVAVQRIWTGKESRTLRFVWSGEALLAGLLLVFEFTHSFYALLLLPAFVVSLVAHTTIDQVADTRRYGAHPPTSPAGLDCLVAWIAITGNPPLCRDALHIGCGRHGRRSGARFRSVERRLHGEQSHPI